MSLNKHDQHKLDEQSGEEIDRRKPCPVCYGTGEIGSTYHQSPSCTVIVTRATQPCPRCSATDLDEQMDHRHREDQT